MRKRLFTVLLGVIGLGVPVLVAWLTRPAPVDGPAKGSDEQRAEDNATEPMLPTAQGNRLPGAPARIREPHPTGLFAAVGRFDYRFRLVLPVVGLALVIGLNVWNATSGGDLIQGGWVIPGSQEQEAADLLASRFPDKPSSVLAIFHDPDGDAGSPAFQAKVADAVEPARDDPAVSGVLTYAEQPSEEFLSADHEWALAVIQLEDEVEDSVEDASRVAGEIQAPAGVEMQLTGVPLLYHEFNDKIERDLVQAETISLPIALVILLAVFGTLVAAGLPLLVAGLALPSAFAVIGLLASVADMSIFVNNLASMIGLALAIDYSLFMVSRFREELRHHDVEIALERMMGSVGKAVAVSGVAVAIGLSSLAVFEAAALRSMGIAGVVTVVATLVYGLTVLPALLALLGHRVNRLHIPLPGFLRLVEGDVEAADRRAGHGAWGWIASRVMRHPILISAPVLAILLALGSPFLSLELSTGQNLEDLPRTPARTGFEVLLDEFPSGESDPITIALTWPDDNLEAGLSPDRQAALADYVAEVEGIDNVVDVESVLDAPRTTTPEQWSQLLQTPQAQWPEEAQSGLQLVGDFIGQDTTRVRVFTDLLPDSDAGRELVGQVREIPPPDGARALSAGLPSRSADFMASFRSSVPVAILIVVAVTGGILFLTFGSVFLPIKAVLMSLISISASFGALVWIFQQGHFADQLGFEPSGALGAWLPVIMFAILFGLSMDYEV
ncbi:MAG TPA: MMPL family transporter, partial [Gemmatimonadales bacterium]|nr:MMPL family transporter [Gemmatimonadales bacterium]